MRCDGAAGSHLSVHLRQGFQCSWADSNCGQGQQWRILSGGMSWLACTPALALHLLTLHPVPSTDYDTFPFCDYCMPAAPCKLLHLLAECRFFLYKHKGAAASQVRLLSKGRVVAAETIASAELA